MNSYYDKTIPTIYASIVPPKFKTPIFIPQIETKINIPEYKFSMCGCGS